jgi:methyl-accepting chemotaxis protein
MDPHREELVECIQGLEALVAATEDEFLHIGSRLRDFYGGAVRIAESASFVAGLMSGDTITKAIDDLHVLAEKMGAYLSRSETAISSGVKRLSDVSETITEIHMRLVELDSVAKTLRMLAISNTIAGVNLKKADEGNKALSDDIKDLSALIVQKSAAINTGTRLLLGYLEETLDKLNSLGASCQVKGGAVMKSTTSSISSLTEKYALSKDAADEISRTSSEISSGMGEVVTSIQFHDIARQRFENSRIAFAGMFQMLFGEEKQGEAPATAGTGLPYLSYEIGAFCEQQTASLRLTKKEFVSAVKRVIDTLRTISFRAKRMFERAGQVTGRAGSSDGSFLSGIQNTLSSVTSTLATLSESEAVAKELSAAVAHADRAIGEMSGFAKEIEEIGDDIGLIAFNAQVRAGTIGGEGKALDVIAEAIQRVSMETKTHTTEISTLLTSMETIVSDLSGADSDSRQSETGVRAISEDLRRLVHSVRQVNDQIISTYDGVSETGRSVLNDIGEVIDGITVHTLVENTINGVLAVVEQISLTTGQLPRGSDTPDAKRGTLLQSGCMAVPMGRMRHPTVRAAAISVAKKRRPDAAFSITFQKSLQTFSVISQTPQGQMLAQKPQPMHLSSSTTYS